MRLNQFIARATGMSRRQADAAIAEGRVTVNDTPATLGHAVQPSDEITLDGKLLANKTSLTTILLNKPVGYVCSRNGQGSKTVYDLLPTELHDLKPVGRLDKDSSGLLLLTNDGDLANTLTHPRYAKNKVYKIHLNKQLTDAHREQISAKGVTLEDGLSQLQLSPLNDDPRQWQVTMQEGRNRQIRRTFAELGYTVTKLHRISFGTYHLDTLKPARYTTINQ